MLKFGCKRIICFGYCSLLLICLLGCTNPKQRPTKTGYQWYPCLEWEVTNTTYNGNPFDVDAIVEFTHQESGKKILTSMFYAGRDTWKYRFTGTLQGKWTYITSSQDEDLDKISGEVVVQPNPDKNAHGFMTHFGNKWGWQGTESVFVPQYVMGKRVHYYYDLEKDSIDEEKINNEIREFFNEHGFTGFHFCLDASWFSLTDEKPYINPDPRTFQVLETIITKIHVRGGACHIWMWGSDRHRNSNNGDGPRGLIGEPMNDIDKRMLNYVAARLGPLPGWSMGFGFDTENGVATREQLSQWKSYLEENMGWNHMLGSRVGYDDRGLWTISPRPPKPPINKKHQAPIADEYTFWLGGDYIGYTSYRPLYDRYREVLKHHPDKPSFEEDRFRLRNSEEWGYKDYNQELTIKGLWHSAMAGGVANIWGNLLPGDIAEGSRPYDIDTITIKNQIRTYASFINPRFKKDMQPETVENTMVLKDINNQQFLLFEEDTDKITFNTGLSGAKLPAIAVDAKRNYKEINIGAISGQLNWTAPYKSNWAVAIGEF
jgi:hypothetical protein